MTENLYKDLNEEELIFKAQNVINEIRAFMNHDVVSGRKISDLTKRTNEILTEIDKRLIILSESSIVDKLLQKKNELIRTLEEFKSRNQESKNEIQPQ